MEQHDKNLDKVEEYVLSLAPNTSLDAVKVHAKNIRFLVNEGQKSKTTPQWMIDFLDEYRRKIGCSMDHDEIRDTDGKVLAIVNWMKDNPNIQQKPAWSEDDKQYLLVCKNALYKYQSSDKWDATIIYNWLEEKLKSIKGRVQPQTKQEWSEEDEQMLESCIDKMSMTAPNLWKKEIYWLKSLKDRVQHNKEWSEEDSERLLRIHQFIWANRKGDTDEIYQQEQDADWLMTLTPNHWKPSEEQINEVKKAIGITGTNGIILLSLYNDLKKL